MQFGATKKLLFQVALLSKYCFFVIFVKADRLTILRGRDFIYCLFFVLLLDIKWRF